MQISEISARIDQLQYELNIENQRGGLKDAAKVEKLEADIAELTAELDKPEVDPIIAKANEELELFGAALRPFCLNDVSYSAIRSMVLAKVYALMDMNSELREQAEKAAEEAHNEIAELSAQIEERDTIVTGMKQDLYEAQLLAEDNANKRDAAHRELLEAKNTIDTLNDKLSSATVAVPKARTNVEGDNSIELFKQSLPAIYDVQDHPTDNRKYVAKLADTDEPVEGLWIYKNGKHREVTAEQAQTFRAEYLAAQQPAPSNEDYSYDIPTINDEVTYTAPAFRSEEESTEGAATGLATETPAVVRSTVTREEFEELKARVEKIESIRAAA